MIEQRGDPLGGPTAFARIVDAAQGLESQRAARAQLVMGAVHGQNRRARGITLVEDVDLGSG